MVPFQTAAERDAYPTARLGQSLNRSDLEREIPGLGSQWSTGLLFEQDGQIDNRRQLMRALERACVSLGVQFMEGAEVHGLGGIPRDSCVESICAALKGSNSN